MISPRRSLWPPSSKRRSIEEFIVAMPKRMLVQRFPRLSTRRVMDDERITTESSQCCSRNSQVGGHVHEELELLVPPEVQPRPVTGEHMVQRGLIMSMNTTGMMEREMKRFHPDTIGAPAMYINDQHA